MKTSDINSVHPPPPNLYAEGKALKGEETCTRVETGLHLAAENVMPNAPKVHSFPHWGPADLELASSKDLPHAEAAEICRAASPALPQHAGRLIQKQGCDETQD